MRGATDILHVAAVQPLISTHAPREGCDLYRGCLVMSYFSLFQSPHPVRGATGSRSCWPPSQCHFNPRTPRGVRPPPISWPTWRADISIHAPREGCDMGGGVAHGIDCISIHAPREGCDALVLAVLVAVSLYFNPRTPRGVRPGAAWTRWSRS